MSTATFGHDETQQLLPYDRLCRELEHVWGSMRRNETRCPVRLSVTLPGEGVLLCMAAADKEFAVTKIVTVNTENASRNQPVVQANVTIMRGIDGCRILNLDGEVVTARRTSALSVAAVLRLAPHTARMKTVRLLIIGNGRQAIAHREAFAAIFAHPDVRMKSRVHRGKRGAAAFAVTRDELQWADVVVTATSSAYPVLEASVCDALRPRAIVCAVGAYTAQMAEIPSCLVRRCRVVVDSREACAAEAGDLIQAGIAAKDMEEICEAEAHPDKDLRPILFKSVGTALWDLAAGRCAVALTSAATKSRL